MFFFETMDQETTNKYAEDFSVEEFDIDFEFDAPRFYDFTKQELDLDKEETELWFESAGNYPPSPFSLNLGLRYEEDHLEITKPISDKHSGFIYYNQASKDVPETTQKSKTKPVLRKNSTLTRPTASLLSKQNKPLDHHSAQLLKRCQRSLGNSDDKLSSVFSSMLQTQDTKRQKLETGFLRKVTRLDQTPLVHKVPKKGYKVTVPKEPNLKTAQRATTRHRLKANSAPEQIMKFTSTTNKPVQESSATSLSKKNTPRSQDLQRFHLRTSLKARERSSNVKNVSTDDPTRSLTSTSVSSRKSRRDQESGSQETNCQTYESKNCPLDSKISSKCGEAIKIKHEINNLRDFEYPKDTKFRDEPFTESLRKLCLTSD